MSELEKTNLAAKKKLHQDSMAETFRLVQELLERKKQEYASEGKFGFCQSPYRNFEEAATLADLEPVDIAYGYMLKHIVSFADIMKKGTDELAQEKWDEKTLDLIAYLVLIRSLMSWKKVGIWENSKSAE